VLGDDITFKFWIDPWIHDACIGYLALDLLAAISPGIRRWWTMAQGLTNSAWIGDIIGALTIPMLIQYL
jgi:hypothetical protein